VSAITGLPLPAVQKAIEYKLIRPKRVREGRFVRRMLSKSQVLYPRMEAKGLKSLALATRRQVARAIERNPGIAAMALPEGGIILIQFKSARKDVDTGLWRLAKAKLMAESYAGVIMNRPRSLHRLGAL
jgi:hypothetical protein